MLKSLWSSILGHRHEVEVPEAVIGAIQSFIESEAEASNENDSWWFCSNEMVEALAVAFEDEDAEEDDAAEWAATQWLENTAKTDLHSLFAEFMPPGLGITQHGHDEFAIESTTD
jgi:hypothetical protein